jgi:hypothetical protein
MLRHEAMVFFDTVLLLVIIFIWFNGGEYKNICSAEGAHYHGIARVAQAIAITLDALGNPLTNRHCEHSTPDNKILPPYWEHS